MKIIVSPTKKMVQDNDDFELSTPNLFKESNYINNYLKTLNKNELKKIWNCSDKIVEDSFNNLKNENNKDTSAAIFSYSGIAFKYMAPSVFSLKELQYINDNLRIISGLYGILKPFDKVKIYRLEMNSNIKLNNYNNLYQFWGNKIANNIKDDLVINLASEEYSKAVIPYLKSTQQVITCYFVENINNKLVQKATICKMARGLLVRFMTVNNINNSEDIKKFNDLDFIYSKDLSDEYNYYFVKEGKIND